MAGKRHVIMSSHRPPGAFVSLPFHGAIATGRLHRRRHCRWGTDCYPRGQGKIKDLVSSVQQILILYSHGMIYLMM
jgi:hypothetical protein